ncbi:MAG: putative LPS assembly protein LptD [Bacteroidota bacterium]
MHTNIRYIVQFIIIFFFGILSGYTQEKPAKIKNSDLKNPDSVAIITPDTTKIDSTIISKEYLKGNIRHKALDYVSNDFTKETATLYNEAELYYEDIELKAGVIIINYRSNLAFAKGIIDSLGNYTQRPEFKQGSQITVQDSLIYNFKNEKALIYRSKTEQQGVIITGNLTKRENDSTFYVDKARFTSSQKENPDYYIQTSNIKVIPNSKIVGGMSNLVIADVPTPLFLPFFYAPITKGRASGFLIPTWGSNRNQGYFLQNGGYYFSINDYFDLALLGDIYTNGSWGLRAESNYALRYKFTGNFSLRYENLINSQLGLPDYSKSTNYFIRWSHSQSAQSNPNSRFSASVNFGSSNFYRQSFNESSSPFYLTNTFSSSVNYYKKFVGTPFNLNASVTHTQNTNTDKVDMNLPSLQVNMDRIYPFAPRSGAKKNALQNIGLTYNMTAQNRISTTGEDFLSADMLEDAQSGVQQNISLGTNMKALKYLTISPNMSYKEVWYLKTIDKKWDDSIEDVVTDTISGFETFREYNANVSASTTVYGMFNFNKGRLQAIRHTMRPSVAYIYRPDFSQYYDEYQGSLDPNDIRDYNKFQNGIYGGPSRGESNSIGLSLNNSLEAKVMPKDADEDTEAKKVKLLNNLNFSTSYNMVADSLNWSPVRMTAGTQILNNKLNVNINASMDPYAINANGSRINKFNIDNGGSLFRLTNAGLSANYSISSKEIGKNKEKSDSDKNKEKSQNVQGDDMFGKNITNRNQTQSSQKEEVKVAKLYNATMPWNFSFRYSLNYSNMRGDNRISSNSLQVSGDLEFSPKWHVGISSGYDFENKGITYTQLRFERDLDSWHFSFNWVPFGDRATYYFFIGVKSGVFSDLKYDQRKIPDKRLF